MHVEPEIRPTQAHARNDLGFVYQRLGRYQEAITNLQDSLAIFRGLSDLSGQAAGLNGLGLVYCRLGQYQEAITSLQDSLTIRRELSDRHGQAASLNNLGNVYQRFPPPRSAARPVAMPVFYTTWRDVTAQGPDVDPVIVDRSGRWACRDSGLVARSQRPRAGRS